MGTGKTSFLNMVKERLGTSVICFDFNPWLFSDQESLLLDFFARFSEAIQDDVPGKKAQRRIATYASKLSRYGFEGVSVAGVSWNPLKAFTTQSVSENRKQVDDLLRGLPRKVVVVVDDIDRLDAKKPG